MSALGSIETQIDMKIIHSAEDPARTQRFRETVLAVYEIIEKKLYKEKNMNIEQYFKTHWNISRAQAYRLYNCGSIVRLLSNFEIQPSRERYCRILKKITRTEQELQQLWAEVLRRVQDNESLITSSLITSVWNSIKVSAGQMDQLVTSSGDPIPSDGSAKFNSTENDAGPYGNNYIMTPPKSSDEVNHMAFNRRPRGVDYYHGNRFNPIGHSHYDRRSQETPITADYRSPVMHRRPMSQPGSGAPSTSPHGSATRSPHSPYSESQRQLLLRRMGEEADYRFRFGSVSSVASTAASSVHEADRRPGQASPVMQSLSRASSIDQGFHSQFQTSTRLADSYGSLPSVANDSSLSSNAGSGTIYVSARDKSAPVENFPLEELREVVRTSVSEPRQQANSSSESSSPNVATVVSSEEASRSQKIDFLLNN